MDRMRVSDGEIVRPTPDEDRHHASERTNDRPDKVVGLELCRTYKGTA